MQKGLTKNIVEQISDYKKEPLWMKKFRLSAYATFCKMKMPKWGGDLSGLNFNNITYYIKPEGKVRVRWKDVPKEIKETYDKLGILKAEQKFLAGVTAQWDSEVVYGSILKKLAKQGVIFLSMDEGLAKHPKLVKRYFGTIIPKNDNKLAALNSSVWSGGSFLYIPKGVHVELPLQAYFRINAKNLGQFERTLIIADEGSRVHYIEGCTSPVYTTDSLHAGVVEIVVKRGARVRYTTVQNWSKNVYNLVTKRAKVGKKGVMEWVDFNGGSKVTMKYPSTILAGEGARVETLSLAVAGEGQHQDTGGKAFHLAPNTTSRIVSKAISYKGGRTSYRGLVKIAPGATNAKSSVVCDSLLLGDDAFSDTYPAMEIKEKNVSVGHEATVTKIDSEQIFYLMTRGLSKEEAETMIVNGFIEPIVKEIPFEYAIELNRLIKHKMEGSIG